MTLYFNQPNCRGKAFGFLSQKSDAERIVADELCHYGPVLCMSILVW